MGNPGPNRLTAVPPSPSGRRGCTATRKDEQPCGATRQRDVAYCFLHDPDASDEITLARKVGGERRRRDQGVAIAYDVTGLRTVDEISALLELTMLETLRLPNAVHRNRTLIDLARVAVVLMTVTDTEERITRLEARMPAARDVAGTSFERGLAYVAAHRPPKGGRAADSAADPAAETER